MNPVSPIAYEINTRVWLAELSANLGRPVTLADIPDEEIERWVRFGFTHIWLMGLWQVGPQARQIALERWRNEWRDEFESSEEDVQGSPYAIQEYAVDERLGQPLELLMLRERLNRAGLKLLLDFVPNHLGVDSSEPRRYPARFVQAPSAVPDTFACETKLGLRHFAHGRDPYFPSWKDTVQVDYRVAEAQEAMSLVAQTISMFGDGLRCDMAMLVLPGVFAQTWKEFPVAGANATSANFWARTIPRIRLLQPSIELIAEAYWDLEATLQDAGFDYTYNKRVTDLIMRRQHEDLGKFLGGCTGSFLRKSVHFLENHDEARAAASLPSRRHKAAAALVLFLPGMTLLHDGQLEGRKRFAHIHLSKRPPEPVDGDVQAFYQDILALLQKTHIRRSSPELIHTSGAIAISWRSRDGGEDIGVVNLSDSHRVVPLPGKDRHWTLFYSTEVGAQIDGADLSVPPESAHIIRYAAP